MNRIGTRTQVSSITTIVDNLFTFKFLLFDVIKESITKTFNYKVI